MLVDNGVATEAEIQAALAKNGFDGRRVADVRVALKREFRDRVVARMTLSEPGAVAEAKKRYPTLSWATNPDAAKAEARQREMVRLTTGLNSGDIGSLAEEWYCEVSGLRGAAVHVHVDMGTLGKQGIVFAEQRKLDLVSGDTVVEIKRVTGPLGDRDKVQFDDLRKIGNAGRAVDVGGGRLVTNVRYTFVHPEGARANEGWMKEALRGNEGLSFEIFNSRGERTVITKDAIERRPNAIRDWLNR
jgi:hypothetical protein